MPKPIMVLVEFPLKQGGTVWLNLERIVAVVDGGGGNLAKVEVVTGNQFVIDMTKADFVTQLDSSLDVIP